MFRLRYAVALAAAVCLISPGVSQSAPTYTWAGTWTLDANTCCGKTPVPMTLDASGNGSYSFCGGTISGAQVTSSTLKGTWTQQAGCANVAETSGAVEFDMATNGKSFTGNWRYASHSGWDGPMNGTCTGGACLNNGAAPTTTQSPSIEVKSLVGEVRVLSRGAGVSRPLKPGDKLQEGDILSTDFDSHVVLEVGNGAEVTMFQMTQVSVNSLFFSADTSRLQLYLRLGQVETRTPDTPTAHVDFSVAAPTATASVRGTRFSVRYAKTGVTTVRAIVHSVRVTPANRSLKPVTLHAGQQVTVTMRKVGPVTKISK